MWIKKFDKFYRHQNGTINLSLVSGKVYSIHMADMYLRYLDMASDEIYPLTPVKIRVRIGPPHPLVCLKRRLNVAVLRMRPEKPRSRVTAGVAR